MIVLALLLGIAARTRLEPIQSGPKEPDWSKSVLTRNNPELTKARKAIQKEYGPIPEAAFLKNSIGLSALKVYHRTRNPVDAFRALYLTVATNAPSTFFKPDTKWEELWKVLPVDDYEVARLHLIWSLSHVDLILKPLGNRLLAIDGNDAELLWQLAFLYSHHYPQSDQVKGIEFAERAERLAPCLRTYLECADAHTAILWYRKKGNDAQIALRYFEKYFSVAPKNDPAQSWAKKTYLLVKNYRQ